MPSTTAPCSAWALEYDGAYHHRGREAQDDDKRVMLELEGHVVIRARESPLEVLAPADVVVPTGVFTDPHATHEAAALVLTAFAAVPGCPRAARLAVEVYVRGGVCVGNEAFERRYTNRVLPDLGGDSIAETRRELIAQLWAYDKNEACAPFHPRHLRAPGLVEEGRSWPWPGPISPRHIRADSTKKVWWQCEEYGDHFVMSPRDVVSGRGCQFCRRKQVNDRNCLGTTDPALAAEVDQAELTLAQSVTAVKSLGVV